MAEPSRIVVVGASLAGLRAAQATRSAGFEGNLVIVGDEDRLPYNRPPLSKELLTGAVESSACELDHEGLEADWRLGVEATEVDIDAHRLRLADGSTIDYDRLIVATGASARPWPGPGADLDGVFTLRTLDDSLALGRRLRAGGRVAVVGAGFLGCEVAACARGLHLDVTLIELGATPMAPLGAEVGKWCAETLRREGVDLRTGVGVAELVGGERLQGVVLTDGSELDADVAVIALGAVPNGGWLEGCGLRVEGASLVCDATLTAVGAPDVLGAGDVVTWPNPFAPEEWLRVEHWSNAVDQGTTAGTNALLEPEDRSPHRAVPSFWSDQFGRRIQSVGLPARAERVEVAEGSLAEDRFVATGFEGSRLISAVSIDATPRLRAYRRTLSTSLTQEDAHA